MKSALLFSKLSAHTELADVLIGEVIASLKARSDIKIGVSVKITVPIQDGYEFIPAAIMVDIEGPSDAQQLFRDLKSGGVTSVKSDDGVITALGVVDGQDLIQIVIVPTADRLRITFRKAGVA